MVHAVGKKDGGGLGLNVRGRWMLRVSYVPDKRSVVTQVNRKENDTKESLNDETTDRLGLEREDWSFHQLPHSFM